MDKHRDTKPDRGVLLVAAANLEDTNFARTVILLCEHSEQGSFGLVLNQSMPYHLAEVIDDLKDLDVVVYRGGPVQLNTLHFLHIRKDLEIGSVEVLPGIYWGGDFDRLRAMIADGQVRREECRFFLGYAGWGEGQLADEIRRESWYLRPGTGQLVFEPDSRNHWRNILATMGPEYAVLRNFPDHPLMN